MIIAKLHKIIIFGEVDKQITAFYVGERTGKVFRGKIDITGKELNELNSYMRKPTPPSTRLLLTNDNLFVPNNIELERHGYKYKISVTLYVNLDDKANDEVDKYIESKYKDLDKIIETEVRLLYAQIGTFLRLNNV